MRHGHDEPVRTPQIEHEHCEPAREQRDREHRREPCQRLVCGPPEHRRERRDVERAGRGHDQEHREHVGQPPHDAVVHAGHVVPLDLHVVSGEDAGESDEPEQHDQREVAGALSFDLAKLDVAHGRNDPFIGRMSARHMRRTTAAPAHSLPLIYPYFSMHRATGAGSRCPPHGVGNRSRASGSSRLGETSVRCLVAAVMPPHRSLPKATSQT